MLLAAGLMIIFGTVFWLVYRQLSGALTGAAKAQLGVAEDMEIKSFILKFSKKLYRGLIMIIARNLLSEDKEKAIRRKLVTAGALDLLPPLEFMAFKIFLGFGLPIGIIAYNVISRAGLSTTMIIGIGLFGWFYPNLWVNGLKKARQDAITLALPFVIDMLTLSTEAGMDFMGAVQKVCEKARPSPLIEELERVLKEVQLGASRGDALRNFAWRVDMESISSFVAILVTADQMGAPIGAVLRAQSDLLRNERFLKAEKAGAAASQKILFPLIFLILPAVFIMIFGPVVLQFIYGGGGGGGLGF